MVQAIKSDYTTFWSCMSMPQDLIKAIPRTEKCHWWLETLGTPVDNCISTAGMLTRFRKVAHPSHADLDQLLPHEAALMHHIIYVPKRIYCAWRGLCSLCLPRPWRCTFTCSRSGWKSSLWVDVEQSKKPFE